MFFRRDAYSPHPHLLSWPYPAFSGSDESGGPRHPVSFKRREWLAETRSDTDAELRIMEELM